MFVSRLNNPKNKTSCLQNTPCSKLVYSPHSILPPEIKMVVLNATNNTITTKNEGNKFGSYARVYAKRNATQMLTSSCNRACMTIPVVKPSKVNPDFTRFKNMGQ